MKSPLRLTYKLSLENMPLAMRISIQMAIPVIMAFVILVSTVIILVREQETNNINKQAQMLARQEAMRVSAYMNASADVAIGLATSLEAVAGTEANDRQIMSAMLERSLGKNSQLLSVWCAFQPNALHSPDSKYVNTLYGNDKGRYTTGFNTAKGSINHDVTDEEGLVPGDGDWYLVPRDNAKDTLVDPYDYAYYPDTPACYETSFAVPIFHNGKVIGVAGSDIALNSLADRISKIRPYGTGYVAIIANNGTFATHPKKSMRGKDIGKTSDMKRVKEAVAAGRELEFTVYDNSINGDARKVLVPIKVGQADAQWALLVSVPMKQALAPVTRLTVLCIVISILALAGVIVAVVIVAKKIASPIRRLSQVAMYLSEGDISAAEKHINCA